MNTFQSIFMCAVCTVFLNGCGVVNKVRLMNANNAVEANWSQGEVSAHPKAEFVYAKPYIFISIDGVDELKMLIDTGSSISMLFDTDKVKKLNLTKGYELVVGGYGGHQNSAAYQTEVSTVSVSSVSYNNVNFGYIPISETKFFLRRDQAGFDGVIGNDLLKDLVWHFDRDKEMVSAFKSMPKSLLNKDIDWIPFDTFFGKISFPVKITFNDHVLERDVILDTGSRYHMSINDTYFGDDKEFPQLTIQSAGYSLSGMALHKKANTPMVEVGSLKLKNVVTNIIREDEDDFWTLGSALLSQFEIVVDYPSKRLGFLPRKGTEFQSQYNLTGLELRKLNNGNFIIGYISPDLEATNLGFSIGEEIRSINGKDAKKITVDEWLRVAAIEGHFEFCNLTLNTCKSIEVKAIEGFSK